MAQSIVDKLKALEAQKNALLDEALAEIKASIDALNAAGYSYKLTDASEESASKPARKARTDSGAIRWSTSVTRILNYAKSNKLTKAQALDAIRLALQKLAHKKGVTVPADVLQQAEQQVAEAIKK